MDSSWHHKTYKIADPELIVVMLKHYVSYYQMVEVNNKHYPHVLSLIERVEKGITKFTNYQIGTLNSAKELYEREH